MSYFGAQNDMEIQPLMLIFNTPLKIAKIKCKPRLIRNQWKIFEKMFKDQNFYLFWDPKWPKIWTSEVYDILHTSKSACNEHVKQYWCETSGNFLRKWPKTWILTCFGGQNGSKIGGPLRPIFHTLLKVLVSMWSNTDVKPVKTFWENDQRPEFWLVLGAKMVPKLGLWGPYSTHRWKYMWACEAILMWNQRKLFEKMTKDLNFDLLWGPKWFQNWASEAHIPHTAESTCEHVKQYWCETSENFLRKWPKSRILTYFGIQNGPKIGPLRPIVCTFLKVAPMRI